MLTFLWLASRQGFTVDRYEDNAVGTLTKNEKGIPWISEITLHPAIAYSGEKEPTPDEEKRLHDLAHAQCYIANSIQSAVSFAPAAPAV
jgi:organic hydroperoxide reductase OsmC/OhrA